MFWLGLIIKIGLPLAVRLGWIDQAEKLLIEAWYAAKKLTSYPPKDIETPNARPVGNTNLESGGYSDQGPRSM